ncbi:MAG: vWA domain-containing protein, partial [Vicinamibacterales bacterium]
LLLWRRVLDESRELTLWERIRRAVSLAVTVLIALALALAAVRPRLVEGAADVAAGRLLIVLDSSWSMQARTRSGETRWERAVAEAHRLVMAASGSEIALATTAEGLVEGPTTDGALIDSALDRVGPTGAEGTAAWPRLAGAGAVHFITDGATARPLDAGVVVHSSFEPAANVAITAFEVRPSLASAAAGDAYLEIANFAPSAQTIRLTLVRGSTTIFNRDLDVAASESLRQVVPIARGADPLLRARIHADDNALAADDEAVIWVDRARPLSITVVGARTDWLRAAFERDPDVRATFVAPAAYRAASDASRLAGDVIIFDEWAPQEPPRRPAILFAPPPDTTWLAGRSPDELPGVPAPAPEERRPRWEVPGTHRVVQGVDPYTLTIDRARAYSSPSLVAVAQSARGTPLVYVSESAGARYVVVSFSADESNLAAAPGFPVLMGNALEWLSRPAAGIAKAPGLIALDAAITRVTDPNGGDVPLTRVNDQVMGLLRTPGLYVAEGGGSRSRIAVNAGDAQLSNLMRTTAMASSGEARAVSAGASGRPWWLYCAAIAFALALAEWWTWQRRITV